MRASEASELKTLLFQTINVIIVLHDHMYFPYSWISRNFLEYCHFPEITLKESGFPTIQEISFKVETLCNNASRRHRINQDGKKTWIFMSRCTVTRSRSGTWIQVMCMRSRRRLLRFNTDRCFVKYGDKSDTLEIVKVDSTCGRLVKYWSLHCRRPYNRKFYLHVFYIDFIFM